MKSVTSTKNKKIYSLVEKKVFAESIRHKKKNNKTSKHAVKKLVCHCLGRECFLHRSILDDSMRSSLKKLMDAINLQCKNSMHKTIYNISVF